MAVLVSLEKIQRAFDTGDGSLPFLRHLPCEKVPTCPDDSNSSPLFSNTLPLFHILNNLYCLKYYNKPKQLHSLRIYHLKSLLNKCMFILAEGLIVSVWFKNIESVYTFKNIFFKVFKKVHNFKYMENL